MIRNVLIAIGLIQPPKTLWINPRFVGPDFKPQISERTAARLRSVPVLNLTRSKS